jgi:hypothetical protein
MTKQSLEIDMRLFPLPLWERVRERGQLRIRNNYICNYPNLGSFVHFEVLIET